MTRAVPPSVDVVPQRVADLIDVYGRLSADAAQQDSTTSDLEAATAGVRALLAAIADAIEAAEQRVATARDEGYSEGYEAGFKDGCARTDLLAAEVASAHGLLARAEAAEAALLRLQQDKALSPDPTRTGFWALHNCGKCSDGRKPCLWGNHLNCDRPNARND